MYIQVWLYSQHLFQNPISHWYSCWLCILENIQHFFQPVFWVLMDGNVLWRVLDQSVSLVLRRHSHSRGHITESALVNKLPRVEGAGDTWWVETHDTTKTVIVVSDYLSDEVLLWVCWRGGDQVTSCVMRSSTWTCIIKLTNFHKPNNTQACASHYHIAWCLSNYISVMGLVVHMYQFQSQLTVLSGIEKVCWTCWD